MYPLSLITYTIGIPLWRSIVCERFLRYTFIKKYSADLVHILIICLLCTKHVQFNFVVILIFTFEVMGFHVFFRKRLIIILLGVLERTSSVILTELIQPGAIQNPPIKKPQVIKLNFIIFSIHIFTTVCSIYFRIFLSSTTNSPFKTHPSNKIDNKKCRLVSVALPQRPCLASRPCDLLHLYITPAAAVVLPVLRIFITRTTFLCTVNSSGYPTTTQLSS